MRIERSPLRRAKKRDRIEKTELIMQHRGRYSFWLSGDQNVLKVRVMFLEYSPRISGTRHGFRVRKGMRRCYMVRIIVLGCAPGVLEYAQVTHRTVYERCQFVFLFFL